MGRCKRYEDIMARFLHGGVLRPEQEELERHLAVCAACEALYRRTAETDRVLREEPDKQVEPPHFLRARIMANLPESAPARTWFAWSRWVAFAGGAVVCALTALVIYQGKVLDESRTQAGSPVAAGAPVAGGTRIAAAPHASAGTPSKGSPRGREAARPGQASTAAAPRVQIIREVKIYFYYPPARKVAVTGDFNGWDPDGVSLESAGKPGLWTAKLLLKPGAYSYNFIVDGETLVPDPGAANQAPDGYGGTNSILLVKEDNPA